MSEQNENEKVIFNLKISFSKETIQQFVNMASPNLNKQQLQEKIQNLSSSGVEFYFDERFPESLRGIAMSSIISIAKNYILTE